MKRKMKLEVIHDIIPLQECITLRCMLKASIALYTLFPIWVLLKGKGEIIIELLRK